MTNKTDKNSNATRSRAEAQSKIEPLPTDTNPSRKYEATFIIGPFGRVRFLVEAGSDSEANAEVERMHAKLLKRPDLCRGAVCLESLKLVDGGQNHE